MTFYKGASPFESIDFDEDETNPAGVAAAPAPAPAPTDRRRAVATFSAPNRRAQVTFSTPRRSSRTRTLSSRLTGGYFQCMMYLFYDEFRL